MSDLVTGEAVPLELRLAKLPSRALAIVLDGIVLALAGLGLLLLFSQVVPDVDMALASALLIAGAVFVLVVIPTTIETLTRGKSLGKAAFGLRVVRDDGGPVRFRHALARALAGVFADFLLTLGVGAVACSLLNSRDKRIGDLLAGTVVVRERIPSTTAPPPAIDPRLTGWASTLELSRLPDRLAMAARTLLARAPQLAPEARDRLTTQLATEVAAVVSPPPPPGTPPWAYLAAVLAERRRRDSLRFAPAEGTPADGIPADGAPAAPQPTNQPPAAPQPTNQPPAEQPPTDQPPAGRAPERDVSAERPRGDQGFAPPS